MNRLIVCLALTAFLHQPLFAQGPAGQTSLKRVQVDGAELNYLDQGKGVPVIFVHAGLEDYRAWLPQMEPFSKRYRTIAYSRRHNYPNPAISIETNYSAITDAEDLAALIGKLKLAPAHIIGISYGAYVTLMLAVRHPSLVRSMVLSEPPVLRWLPKLKGGQPLFTDFMTKLWQPATRGFQESDEAGVQAAMDGFGQLGYSGTDVKMTFASLPPEIRSMILSNATEWKALTMSKDAFPTLPFSTIKNIRVPTLLLSGQRSLALHHVIDRQLNRLLVNSERIVVPNATHEMWNEHPDECRRFALEFLAKH